jgi:hypothetical protein
MVCSALYLDIEGADHPCLHEEEVTTVLVCYSKCYYCTRYLHEEEVDAVTGYPVVGKHGRLYVWEGRAEEEGGQGMNI